MPERLSNSEKQLIRQLHEKQHFLEEITNNIADIVYVRDVQKDKVVFVNRKAEELLGHDNLQLDLVHPQDVQLRARHLQKCRSLCSNQALEMNFRLKAKVGDWQWFRVKDKALKYDTCGNVSQLIGVLHHIQERIDNHETIISREIMLQNVLDAPHMGIVHCKAIRDSSGQIVDYEFVAMSRDFEEFYQRSDLFGKRVFEEFPFARATDEHRWADVVENGTPYDFETAFMWEGKERWFHIRYTRLMDGFLSVWEDITSRKQ